MATNKGAWRNATDACIKHICAETSFVFDKTAFRGDRLPEWVTDAFVFQIGPLGDGGLYQAANATKTNPGNVLYTGTGIFVAQFDADEECYAFHGKIADALPAHNSGTEGIEPNVRMFRLDNVVPAKNSFEIEIQGAEDQKTIHQVQILTTVLFDGSTN